MLLQIKPVGCGQFQNAKYNKEEFYRRRQNRVCELNVVDKIPGVLSCLDWPKCESVYMSVGQSKLLGRPSWSLFLEVITDERSPQAGHVLRQSH